MTARWPVPNTVIPSLTGWLAPGGLASGNTNIDILDNDHRLIAELLLFRVHARV